MATILEQAINLAKSGNREEAEVLLQRVLADEPDNESALMWLSGVSRDRSVKLAALQKVVSLNPDNALARKGLARFGAAADAPRAGDPPTTGSPSEGAGSGLGGLFSEDAATAPDADISAEMPTIAEPEIPDIAASISDIFAGEQAEHSEAAFDWSAFDFEGETPLDIDIDEPVVDVAVDIDEIKAQINPQTTSSASIVASVPLDSVEDLPDDFGLRETRESDRELELFTETLESAGIDLPGGGAGVKAPKRSRRLIWVLLAILVLIVLCAIGAFVLSRLDIFANLSAFVPPPEQLIIDVPNYPDQAASLNFQGYPAVSADIKWTRDDATDTCDDSGVGLLVDFGDGIETLNNQVCLGDNCGVQKTGLDEMQVSNVTISYVCSRDAVINLYR